MAAAAGDKTDFIALTGWIRKKELSAERLRNATFFSSLANLTVFKRACSQRGFGEGGREDGLFMQILKKKWVRFISEGRNTVCLGLTYRVRWSVYKSKPKMCAVDKKPRDALEYGQLWRAWAPGRALAKKPPSICKAAHQKGQQQQRHLNVNAIKNISCGCDTKLLLLFLKSILHEGSRF